MDNKFVSNPFLNRIGLETCSKSVYNFLSCEKYNFCFKSTLKTHKLLIYIIYLKKYYMYIPMGLSFIKIKMDLMYKVTNLFYFLNI